MDGDALPLLDRLSEDYLARLRTGERPELEEYCARHPELAEQIRDVFPTLRFLEQFKPTPDDAAHDERTGDMHAQPRLEHIGDYRILREIGRGGMGVVYEAEQLSLGRHVALKVLPARAAHDETATQRFQREARSAAQLQHPNIVPIIDIGSDGDVRYYAMQYVPGRSLDEVQDEVRRLRSHEGPDRGESLISDTPEPGSNGTSKLAGRQYWYSIAKIGVQVANALAFAHERGIVHRDIKPSNLLLDPSGTVWVTDFGLAKVEDSGLTNSGDVVGTLRFMSPERFRGQCDERADVFALGATLYELLVLQPAFHSPDRLHLIERITKEDPKPPRSIDPSVPVDLETIVMKALEKDPRRRYESAKELGDDLQRFVEHQPIHARRTSPLGRVRRWVARNRALATSIAVIATLVTGTALFTTIVAVRMSDLATQSERARQAVERQLYRSQIDRAATAIADGRIEIARPLLAEAPEHLRGFEWFHLASRFERSFESGFPSSMLATSLLPLSNARWLVSGLVTFGSSRFTVVDEAGLELARLDSGVRQYVAMSRSDDSIVLFGETLERWKLDPLECVFRGTHGLSWAVDLGKHGYLTYRRGHAELRDGDDDHVLIDAPCYAWWAAYHPGRDALAMAYDSSLGLCDPTTLQPLLESYPLPDAGQLLGGTWSPDGSLFGVMTASGRMWLIGFEDGRFVPCRELHGSTGTATVCAFSPDGRFFIVGTRQGRVHVWDTASGAHVVSYSDDSSCISSIEFDRKKPDRMIVCDRSGKHRAWLIAPPEGGILRGHTSFVYDVQFSHDGSLLVSGGWDGFTRQPGSLRIWDATTGEPIAAHLAPETYVRSLEITKDDSRVVAAISTRQETSAVVVYDLASGRELRRFDEHNDTVVGVALHPDGRRVVSVGGLEEAILWDLESGIVQHRWPVQSDIVDPVGCAISPDGHTLALTRRRSLIALIDLDSGAIEREWQAHAGAITQLAFTRDGTRLLSASEDDTTGVWDTATGERIAVLGPQGADVLCCAESPDGTRIVTGGRDGSVLFWETEHHELVARFVAHRDYVHALAWNPRDALVTASGDGTLRPWTTHSLPTRMRTTLEKAPR
ncbi:MAG: protein kinase [Planctomycetes bacterium]|nr:protein kinase [Planctomycetota bacterium]